MDILLVLDIEEVNVNKIGDHINWGIIYDHFDVIYGVNEVFLDIEDINLIWKIHRKIILYNLVRGILILVKDVNVLEIMNDYKGIIRENVLMIVDFNCTVEVVIMDYLIVVNEMVEEIYDRNWIY